MHIFHAKKLLLVTFYDDTVGIGARFRTHGWRRTKGQTDVEVEIVI